MITYKILKLEENDDIIFADFDEYINYKHHYDGAREIFITPDMIRKSAGLEKILTDYFDDIDVCFCMLVNISFDIPGINLSNIDGREICVFNTALQNESSRDEVYSVKLIKDICKYSKEFVAMNFFIRNNGKLTLGCRLTSDGFLFIEDEFLYESTNAVRLVFKKYYSWS